VEAAVIGGMSCGGRRGDFDHGFVIVFFQRNKLKRRPN